MEIPVHVYDANILIDAEKLGPARDFVALPGRSLITDMCWNEARSVKGIPIGRGAGKLEVVEVGDNVADLFRIDPAPGCSPEDRSALWLTERERGTLLTSDKLLRRTAESRGTPVHGLLWIIRRNWQEGRITKAQALRHLDRLENDGPEFRLPKDEIQKLRSTIERG